MTTQNILNDLKARGNALRQLSYQQKWLLLFLLPVFFLLFGCGGSVAGQQSGTPVPNEFVGQWQSITTSVPTYFPWPANSLHPWVPPVSVYESGSFGVFLYFWPDGHYELDTNLMTFTYSCLRTLRRKEPGTVTIVDSEFTFNPSQATFSVTDTCDGTAFENPVESQSATLTVTPTQDDTGWPYLHVVYPDGELWLERCRTCQ